MAQSSYNPLLSDVGLAAELSQLQQRYDALLATKERAAERYRNDYKKWRRFKEYLFQEDREVAQEVQENPAGRKMIQMASILRKRKRFTDLGLDTILDQSEAALSTSNADEEALDGLSGSGTHGQLADSRLRPSDEHSSPSTLQTRNSSILHQDELRSQYSSDGMNNAGASHRTHYSTLTALENDQTIHSLDALPVTSTTARSRLVSVDRTRGDEHGIRTQFMIDPDQNEGLDFQFHGVVRNYRDRKRLPGDDCECCRDYYEAVGAQPERQRQPLWRSPTGSPHKQCKRPRKASFSGSEGAPESDERVAMQLHRNEVSRHRQQWAGPSTPPGYWDIGFPDTQQAAEINRRAHRMIERKGENIRHEANRPNGKYKRVE
ncbi:hypothetical protein PUNSTDRAFT_114129 [Punctularia strigosozonata HHB-11173 SS5]|uniref:uncharacterized protein n=1 Tax=Punctularia strigosozonata (strain HHB-11173) TaxID=741275 RepID=UPI0004416C88|nr:uncharacterized protein PUNSTDRAFT_114129 [Punctularia strigosozonata HHB-11173 SS5]EIN07620.1 hypothetical protein PUNSTDRAFT_114129 [Punctularia strigosozonata HHB-11173 SS5]